MVVNKSNYKIIGLFIYCLFLFLRMDNTYAKTGAVILNIGETYHLKTPIGSTIFISRKGYFDINKTSETEYILTALKKGEIVVIVKSDQGKNLSQITFNIASTKIQKSSNVPNNCSIKTINCQNQPFPKIDGVTNLWRVFYSLRSWCKKLQPTCSFQLKLSNQGLKSLQEYLNNSIGKWIDFEILPNNSLLLKNHCPKNKKSSKKIITLVQSILMDDLPDLPIHSPCWSQIFPNNFIVDAKVFLLKSEEASKFGLKLPGSIDFNPILQITKPSKIKLNAYLQENQTKIIGHPRLRLISGETGEFQTGSELFTAPEKESQIGSWKKVGFHFKIKIESLKDEQVLVWYQIEITEPSGASNQLHSSQMSSTFQTKLEHPIIVGELNSMIDSDRKDSIPFIRKIPIIGPIFRNSATGSSTAKLYFWIEISEDTSTPKKWWSISKSRKF